MDLFVITVTLFWPVTVGVLVLIFWICKIIFGGGHLLLDYARGRKTRVGTAVRCPNGHVIPTEGDIYQCEGCGFVYASGSIWVCENVECQGVTPFLNCHECQLSVRNPYRYGH